MRLLYGNRKGEYPKERIYISGSHYDTSLAAGRGGFQLELEMDMP